MKKAAHAFSEENIKYLREVLGDKMVNTFFLFEESAVNKTSEDQETYETVKKCLDQMEKFGDNRWWTSKDKRVLGYYQLMNPTILLVPFPKFCEALDFLLGHHVKTLEIARNYDFLKAEAEKAFKSAQNPEK